MPNTAQINHYMISHGVKDQLLAMFDQALSSNRLDQHDPWYVKSIFDLTYLVRSIATEAVNESTQNQSKLLLPFERRRKIDNEVLKIYWHFFNNQDSAYGDLRSRYSGIELLKTIGYLLQESNFLIQNPNNIPTILEHTNVHTWGKSFIDIAANEKNAALIKEEIKALDAIQSQFDQALSKTKAFRSGQKNILAHLEALEKQLSHNDGEILGDESHVRDVASSIHAADSELPKLSKLMMFTKVILSEPAQEAYAERLKVAYKKILMQSDRLDDLKHLALTAHRLEHNVSAPKLLQQGLSAHKALNELTLKLNQLDEASKQKDSDARKALKQHTTNFDIKKMDEKVKKLLETNQAFLTDFEHKLLSQIQNQLGIAIGEVDQKTYDELEPLVLKAINEDNLICLEQYLGGYTNLLTIDDIQDGAHPSLHKIIKFSRGEKIELSDFEQRILTLIDEKLGYSMVFMDAEDFAVLQPIVSNAFEQNKITDVYEAFYTFSDQMGYKLDLDHDFGTKRIDMARVHPNLKNMLRISLNQTQQGSHEITSQASSFEVAMLNKLESTLGFPLAEMDGWSFEALEPYLLSAIRTNDMDQIDRLLAVKYTKKPFVVQDNDLSHEAIEKMLWPSRMTEKVAMSNKLNEVKSLFAVGAHFKRTEKSSFNEFKYLFERPEMKAFYLGLAVKMCSYTQSLLGKQPLLGEKINLEEVNPEFKARTMDVVFKFASFAKVLECDCLTTEESEQLQAAVEKTVNLIYMNTPDPYLPMAKWTMKRFEKIQGKSDLAVDTEKLALFSAAYSMDFEDPKKHLLLQLSNDSKYEQLNEKLNSIGGFEGLTKKERLEFIKLYNMSKPEKRLYVLDKWVSKKFILSVLAKDDTISEQHEVLASIQGYNESAKNLILEYYTKKSQPHGNKTLVDFIAFNEMLFQKPFYAFSNKRVVALEALYSDDKVDYKAWRAWLNESGQERMPSRHLDILSLYDVFASKNDQDATKQAALSRVLDLCKKSQRDDLRGRFAPNLTLIEEKSKSGTLDLSQLSSIINHKIEGLDDLPPLIPVLVKTKQASEQKNLEMDNEIEAVLLTLEANNVLPAHVQTSLLAEGTLEDLHNVKRYLSNMIDKDPSNASVLLDAEKLMHDLGYQTDFTDEAVEDLSAYQVFFNHFNSILKDEGTKQYLKTSETKQFSPKVIKDALLAQRKQLKAKLAAANDLINVNNEKNVLAENFTKDLMMVNTAFTSVNNKKGFDAIKRLENFKVQSYNKDDLVPMMARFMETIKPVDLIDENNLADVIKVLRVLQSIKTFGAPEIKAFFPNMSQNKIEKVSVALNRLRKQYFSNVKQTNYADKALKQQDFESFVTAVRALQNKSFETESEFGSLSREGYFNVSLAHILDALTVEQAAEMIAAHAKDENEKGAMLQALKSNKRDLVINALNMGDAFVDLDLEEVTDHSTLITRTLFALSKEHTDVFDGLLKKHMNGNDNCLILRVLESHYIDHMRANANNDQEKLVIDSLQKFALSGLSEMFIEYMMYLMPKNTDRVLLDKLIAQFAPAWNYKLVTLQNKETLDTALSALLLSHHGAHKLVKNNVEYYMPIQMAWLGIILSLALFIVATLLWAWPLQVVFGCSLVATIFMRIYIEHLVNMALEPYAISDQRGLAESPQEVDAIYAKYDNIEAKLVMRMLEDLQLLKDGDSFKKFVIEIDARLKDADLVKVKEYEERFNIVPKNEDSIRARLNAILPKLKTLVDRKIFLKEIVPNSSIVLSDEQYEKIIELKEHVEVVMEASLPMIEDDEHIKNILYTLYRSENIEVSRSKLTMLYDFILMKDSADKANIQLQSPMKDMGELESAKLLSAIDRIKKIKAQMEPYTENDDYFPSYERLLKIEGISASDVALMREHDVKSFRELIDLVDPMDYSGTGLSCKEYNQSIVDLIENYMRSSGDTLRVVNKIKPMTMFGSLKLKTDDLEINDQSSASRPSVVRI